MRCPFCGDYSMTLDLMRLQFICHVYGAVVNIEDMPPTYQNGWYALGFIGAEGLT